MPGSLFSPGGILTPRRDFLLTGGGLALAGYSLSMRPGMAHAASLAGGNPSPVGGRARSCILVYLLGGPPHLDTFDPKPQAPAEVRGPFQPIPTNVPGIDICEHFPLLSRMADRYALVRSVSHPNSNHTPMIYYTLTGRQTARPAEDNDVRPPQRGDFPHLGSVVAQVRGGAGALPGYVAIPEVAVRSSTSGQFKRARTPLRGGGGGFLGARYDPLSVNGDPGTPGAIPALVPPQEVSRERFERRSSLLEFLNRRSDSIRDFDDIRQRAAVLTGSSLGGSPAPFTLESEPVSVRDRYGRHRFGRAMLLARRLVEADVPFVSVHFNEMTVCDGWDTHSKNFDALRGELLPMVDQSLSALIDDLDERGRLDETVILCLGEFGRTPKINAAAGRDHWGPCSSALLAGGGLRGGQVVGASDKIGAAPVTDPVDPVDLHATMYHALGMAAEQTIHDQTGRPWQICEGRPIGQLL